MFWVYKIDGRVVEIGFCCHLYKYVGGKNFRLEEEGTERGVVVVAVVVAGALAQRVPRRREAGCRVVVWWAGK